MPNILSIVDGIIPSNAISILKPLTDLRRDGTVDFRCQITSSVRERHLNWADIVIFCRNIHPSDLLIVNYLKSRSKPIIYDIDDNFFAIPIDTALGRYHRHPPHIFTLEKFLSTASLVRVYSPTMLETCGKYNHNVHLCKTYFDFGLIRDLPKPKRDDSLIKIVYATSRGDSDTLSAVYTNAMIEILKKHQHVNLYCYGSIPQPFSGLKNVIKINYVSGYSKFIKSFYKMGYDIGLAPLKNDTFHNSKTNNKFREYGAMGVAGIYSDAPIYTQCVKNEVSGLLVSNDESAWYNALDTLIINHALRRFIQDNAKKSVEINHNYPAILDEWKCHINGVSKHIISLNEVNDKKKSIKLRAKRSILFISDSGTPPEKRSSPILTVIAGGFFRYGSTSLHLIARIHKSKFDFPVYFASSRNFQFVRAAVTSISSLWDKFIVDASQLPLECTKRLIDEFPSVLFIGSKPLDNDLGQRYIQIQDSFLSSEFSNFLPKPLVYSKRNVFTRPLNDNAVPDASLVLEQLEIHFGKHSPHSIWPRVLFDFSQSLSFPPRTGISLTQYITYQKSLLLDSQKIQKVNNLYNRKVYSLKTRLAILSINLFNKP